MNIQTQPFEVADFSGGITDNILQGDPRRSAKLQNFLITVDHKLEVRPGYQPGLGLREGALSPNGDFQLPSGQQRVNNLFSVIDETYLFGQSGRSLYYYNPISAWTLVSGPRGNPAIQGGDNYNQTTVAEFQRQFYLASDGGQIDSQGVQPSKVFRDTTNTWVARTAGLPRFYAQPTFNNGSLLSACISLANALRTALINHINDVVPGNVYNKNNLLVGTLSPPNFTNLHTYLDKYSLSYFSTQSFSSIDAETPTTIPTPAPAATDQATLFTLVGALNASFSHHVSDPTGAWTNTAGQGFYHYSFWFMCPANSPYFASYNIPKGPHVLPTNPGTPAVAVTDLDNSNALLTCANMLNDLYQKYNWHRLAVNTHGPNNDPLQIDKYKPAVGKIGAVGTQGITNITLVNSAPTISPDYTDCFNYVNNLRNAYNAHVNSATSTAIAQAAGAHKQGDYTVNIGAAGGLIANFARMSSNLCRLANCTDLDSMYLLIYWLRTLYGGLHVNDANSTNFIRTQMDATAASASVINVKRTDTATAITLSTVVGNNMFIPGTVSPTGVTFNGPLVSFPTVAGSGTATFQRQLSSTQNAVIGQYSDSLYHASWSITSNDVNTTSIAQESSASFIQTSLWSIGTDTKSWLDLATEFFYSFASHVGGTGNNASQTHVWNSTIQPLMFSSYIPAMTASFFIPTVSQASYAFFWTHQYTVELNGIQYLTQGNPVFTNALDIAVSYPPGYSIVSQNSTYYPSTGATVTRSNVISGLLPLVNDNSSNYDTTNALLNIYRTTDSGTTWYLVSQVANGTTTYTDVTNDSISVGSSTPLSTNQKLYTSGGVVGYDQAPISKFIHILGGTAYYGGITDTGQYFPQRIRQSIPFAPDSSPATFFLDLDDEITGLSSTKSNVLALCRTSVYRVTGQFNILGQGAMAGEKISDGIGCVNAKGIVRTEIGVFFAGTDGFYYTDGFQLIKISLEIDKTYKALVQTAQQQQGIYGCFDKLARRIWWSMRGSPYDSDNSITYIFDLNFGVKPSGVFTTATDDGVGQIRYWRPSSMIFWQGTNIRGDERGYVFRAYPEYKTDPKIDITVAVSAWNTVYIPWEYRSLGIDFGGTANRKWITRIHIVGKNTGNSAIQINAIRDMNSDGDGIKALTPTNYIDNITWGNPICIWEDPATDTTIIWDNLGKMDLTRRFPQTSLRSNFMQIQMLPATIAVYASSVDYPVGANCTVDNVLLTATILTPSGYTAIIWPLDVVDYQIYFQTDSYVKGYAVTAVSGTVITFTDPALTSTLVSGAGTGWMIKGVKKEQRPTISSYLLNFAYFGDAFQDYSGRYSNSGPGNAGENPS